MVTRAQRYLRSRTVALSSSVNAAIAQPTQGQRLSLSFESDTDRELFATELEFAFRKSPRRFETWNASIAVPVLNANEANYVKRLAQKYDGVKMSNTPVAASLPGQDPAQQEEEAPMCEMSMTFETPQSAVAFATNMMKMGAKTAVDGTAVKCSFPFAQASKALSLSARSLNMGSSSVAAGPTSMTFTFENAAKAKLFKTKASAISQGEVQWDGGSKVKFKGPNEGKLREARAIARSIDPKSIPGASS